MHRILVSPDVDAWREAARDALRRGYTPEQLDFQDATVSYSLDLLALDSGTAGAPVLQPHVPKAFLESAKIAATHRDPQRWNLLYRLLFRLQQNRDLLKIEIDNDVAELKLLEQQVRRDLHKMHAFVRFRKVEEPGPDGAIREHYIAWYRPDHRILHLAAPFFAERFAPMRWTILTPDESASWDPGTQQLNFADGTGRDAAPCSRNSCSAPKRESMPWSHVKLNSPPLRPSFRPSTRSLS